MLTFTPASQGAAAIQLASDSLEGDGGTLLGDGLMPALESEVQSAAPFRGATVTRFARGHVQASLNFSIWRTHDTLAKAIGWMHDEPGRLIDQKGTLTHTDQGARRVYANAIFTGISPAQRTGVATVINYRVVADPAA